jgi:hypothetical protein
MKDYKRMRKLKMNGKKIVDKIKGKVRELGKIFGDAVGGLLPQPTPELVPIPVRNPSGRRPQPRRDYNGCNW